MPSVPISHPDRAATTLATVDSVRAAGSGAGFATPEAGSRDCRIDLKLLAWKAQRACEQSAAARDRLAAFDPTEHPDLWAGTVRDGTARGFCVALEEAIALAPANDEEAAAGPRQQDPAPDQVFEGRQLRGKKDIMVASGGARVSFTRREGLLYKDRENGIHSTNCLRFEARADRGTLDAFAGDDATRPRLFSAQFLRPVHYVTAPGYAELRLAGRLGRSAIGWDTEIRITGRETEPTLRLEIRLGNTMNDWRLRARFLGIPSSQITHECADVREVVANSAGGLTAFTLVRACGRLLVDGEPVAVPAAQCHGTIVHHFRIG